MKLTNKSYSLQDLCGLFGYSRQAFYKQQRLQIIEQSRDGLILQQVLQIRNEQPRCGTKKLLIMLQPFFKKQGITIGRDVFSFARGLAKPTPGFNPRSISFKVIAAYATDLAGKIV